MWKSRFLYDIYEESDWTRADVPRAEGWQMSDRYSGYGFSTGAWNTALFTWQRTKEKDVVLHEEDLKIRLEVGSKVRVGDEIVEIKDVVFNLDGSIDYYTKKKVYIRINQET